MSDRWYADTIARNWHTLSDQDQARVRALMMRDLGAWTGVEACWWLRAYHELLILKRACALPRQEAS
jgi:hypothetical protein